MVINKAPITLCLEPITECILPQRKGAANATERAIMISMTSRGGGSPAGPAARRPERCRPAAPLAGAIPSTSGKERAGKHVWRG